MVDDSEVLKDDAEVSAQEWNRLVGQLANIATAEEDSPLVHGEFPVHELQKRALAGAAGPRDEHELPTLNL